MEFIHLWKCDTICKWASKFIEKYERKFNCLARKTLLVISLEIPYFWQKRKNRFLVCGRRFKMGLELTAVLSSYGICFASWRLEWTNMGLTKMGDTYSSYNVGTIQIWPRLCKKRRFIFSEKPCRCYLHCRYSLVSRLKEKWLD